ncbi:MAG TPA: amidohydrolase, partial [Chitinophagales bacterium]|nr:amidohydrolase [Chitinophagales bacterium]
MISTQATNDFRQKATSISGELLRIRRHIHMHPELSMQEKETAAFVSSKLNGWNIKHSTGWAGHGLVAIVQGKTPGRCIALRSDLDALPIEEKNDVPYKSKNPGVMHACGHDVHTACLLGAAKMLHDTRDEWSGTVKLLFQPSEEKLPGGASIMIKEGALENPRP